MKKMGISGDKKDVDSGEEKPKATPKPKATRTSVKRKAATATVDDTHADEDNSKGDREGSISGESNKNGETEVEESPTKKRKTAAVVRKGKAAIVTPTVDSAEQDTEAADEDSNNADDNPLPAKSAGRGKKAATVKSAAKKTPAAKAKKNTTPEEEDDDAENKPKPAAKGKPRGKAAAKKAPESAIEEIAASDDDRDDNAGDKSHDQEVDDAAIKHDKPLPTRTRDSSAKPISSVTGKAIEKVEVKVPATKGGRAALKNDAGESKGDGDDGHDDYVKVVVPGEADYTRGPDEV